MPLAMNINRKSVFLQDHFSHHDWNLSRPHGSGKESYFIHGNEQHYFVKVGIEVECYQAMAEIGLAPPVVFHGQLASGETVIVQSFIEGREPSRKDYREQMSDVAEVIHKLHNNPRLKEVLEPASSNLYKNAGLLALECLCQKGNVTRHKSRRQLSL